MFNHEIDLLKIRNAHKKTTFEAANAINISEEEYISYESHKNEIPLHQLNKLAELYEINIKDFFKPINLDDNFHDYSKYNIKELIYAIWSGIIEINEETEKIAQKQNFLMHMIIEMSDILNGKKENPQASIPDDILNTILKNL